MIVQIPYEVDESKIRMERARLKISQRQLAEEVNISRERINSIENAKCKIIRKELLEKIAKVFNLEVKDLIKKEER